MPRPDRSPLQQQQLARGQEGHKVSIKGRQTFTAALRRRPLTSTKQLKELSGRRNRLFAYDPYLAILSEGTEPL